MKITFCVVESYVPRLKFLSSLSSLFSFLCSQNPVSSRDGISNGKENDGERERRKEKKDGEPRRRRRRTEDENGGREEKKEGEPRRRRR